MWKILLASIVFIGICVLGLGFNIFFRSKPFPNGEISTNKDMQRLGIKCAKQEELEMLQEQKKGRKVCDGKYSDACASCSLYGLEKH